MEAANTYTAFEGDKAIFRGTLTDVILKTKKRMGKAEHGAILIFSDATGNTMDFNFQGTEKDVLKRLEVFVQEKSPEKKKAPEREVAQENPGPGRPKLGVVSREVSLLPRQWEWLASQSGGASVTLRKLIDEAKKKNAEGNSLKQTQEKTYKFMSVLAGNRKGYEEALRALYRKDQNGFKLHMEDWPPDIKAHAFLLAAPVFAGIPK